LTPLICARSSNACSPLPVRPAILTQWCAMAARSWGGSACPSR